MKPSAETVLAYLIRNGWTRNRTLMEQCPTDTPTKRISELHKARLIVKRRCPTDPRYVEYRAKTMPEILMGGNP
jgi:DNA-binding HxlR family transcriptional regulator